MQSVNRPIALALLLMAVLCSPAGVCSIEGMAATVQTAEPTHAHSCGKNVEGTVLTAIDDSCCSESRTRFVTVLRFTLEKQVAALAFEFGVDPPSLTRIASFRVVDRRTPLVLRI